MSFGFVTASGKNVKVSNEALKKAKSLFEGLEADGEHGERPSSSFRPPNSDAMTPVRGPGPFISLGHKSCKSSAFISPLAKNGSPTPNVTWGKSVEAFQSPLKENFPLAPPKTPSTPRTPSNGRLVSKSVTPIKFLTPYCKNWRLCVKVTEIEGTRRFRGMEVFSFLAADDGGVEVRVTGFNDLAQKTAASIEIGQMYYISKASVRPVNKRFGRNTIDTEVVIRPDTEIILCTDQPVISSPKVHFVFVKLKNLMNFIDSEIDFIGIIREVSEVKQITGKSGEVLFRRDVEVLDDTGYSVNLLLWGDRANTFHHSVSQVLAVKGALVRAFQGSVTVSTVTSSKIVVDPDLAETRSLSSWYRMNKEKEFLPLSTKLFLTFEEHKWIREVKNSSEPQYFSIVVLILNINLENAVYKGCEKCRKKLIESDGEFHCGKCGVTSRDYKYFYSLNLEVCDFTGCQNISVFNECAEKLVEEPADEVAKFIKYDYDEYCSRLKKLLFKKLIFRIAARTLESPSTTVQPSSVATKTTRWSALDVSEINYDSYLSYLTKCVKAFTSDHKKLCS